MNLSYERKTEGKQRGKIKRSLRKAERTRLEAPRETRTGSTALLLSQGDFVQIRKGHPFFGWRHATQSGLASRPRTGFQSPPTYLSTRLR